MICLYFFTNDMTSKSVIFFRNRLYLYLNTYGDTSSLTPWGIFTPKFDLNFRREATKGTLFSSKYVVWSEKHTVSIEMIHFR